MKLKAELLNTTYDLLFEQSAGRLKATIDGRSYELELRQVGGGEYLLQDGSKVFACHIGTHPEQPQVFEVHLQGRSYEVKLVDLKRLRSGQTAGRNNDGAALILASMPGKVVRVLVEVGAEVQAGAGIVVVEAMKMQNEMKTPKAGTVTSLKAVTGATVNAGEVLAVIE